MQTIKFLALCFAAALITGCQEATQPSSEASPSSVRAGAPPTITITDLGTFGGPQSTANAINPAGAVVGSADSSNGRSDAFLWQHATMTDLGTLGGGGSYATAINP